MEPHPRNIQPYQDANGNYPFENWLTRLRDRTARVKIQARLDRLSLGNFGDSKFVGDGVYELRINYGAGYRTAIPNSERFCAISAIYRNIKNYKLLLV